MWLISPGEIIIMVESNSAYSAPVLQNMLEQKYKSTLTLLLSLNSWTCIPEVGPDAAWPSSPVHFLPHSPRWQSHLLVFPQRSNTFVPCSLSTHDLTLCFTEKLGIFSRNFLGFIICLLASVVNAFSPSLLVSRVSPSASSLDYCSSKSGPWSSSSDITWKLLSHTESQAPSFHQITLTQSLTTPMLPNSVLNSQSSSFSTNQQYFTICEFLLFEVFCSLAYQFSFLVLLQCHCWLLNVLYRCLFFFLSSYPEYLGHSSLSCFPYAFFFSQWLNTVLGLKLPCADNSQVHISSPDVYPELSHVLMFMYLIAICCLTDIINQQVQNKILTVPQRSALPPVFPIWQQMLHPWKSPLTTLFPSHNPLGNNVNFISKIGLDSHCFSLFPLLSCWSSPSSFLIVLL